MTAPDTPPRVPLNTFEELELADGSTVRLTLTARTLHQLRGGSDQRFYAAAGRVLNRNFDLDDVEAQYEALYAAYLCALVADTGGTDCAIGYEAFADLLPVGSTSMTKAFIALFFREEARAFETPS